MAAEVSQIQLNDEDVAFLLTLLRNAGQPLTTQELIDALRRQGDGARAGQGSS